MKKASKEYPVHSNPVWFFLCFLKCLCGKRGIGLILLFLFSNEVATQTISNHLPLKIESNQRYLFYLHGAVVSVLGDNAINNGAPEWGPYEYSKILDSLRVRGFNVISEIRKNGAPDSVYYHKIVKQIDTLVKAGVSKKSILLIGASAGWGVVLHVADILKDRDMRYVIMGGCWPDTYEDYEDLELRGHYLSVREASDPHGTCTALFENRATLARFKEIKLNTGLSHGFFYKGRRVWIDPIMEWFFSRQ